LVVPVKAVATVITIAFGGSAGKEGPCAQIGAGLASSMADLLQLNDHDRRKIVICGISAGFAAVFGTPIAGAIFGVEVLFVGGILYEVLLPSFIAGITAFQVSSALGIQYFDHAVNVTPVFTETFLMEVALAGVFMGLMAFLLIELMRASGALAARLPRSPVLRAFAGGTTLVGLTLLLSTDFLGLGLDTIAASLHGAAMPWHAPVMKSVFTAVTLSFGGSGGIVTPLFYIGATSGSVFAEIFHLDPATFAAIGLVAVLAGAANTPIAGSIMALELFGPGLGRYAAVACVISFLMTGHRSVFPAQVLAMRKSSSIDVELGAGVDTARVSFRPDAQTLTSKALAALRQLRERAGRHKGQ
jgi:H+/Cl- antiporter ClcA